MNQLSNQKMKKKGSRRKNCPKRISSSNRLKSLRMRSTMRTFQTLMKFRHLLPNQLKASHHLTTMITKMRRMKKEWTKKPTTK